MHLRTARHCSEHQLKGVFRGLAACRPCPKCISRAAPTGAAEHRRCGGRHEKHRHHVCSAGVAIRAPVIAARSASRGRAGCGGRCSPCGVRLDLAEDGRPRAGGVGAAVPARGVHQHCRVVHLRAGAVCRFAHPKDPLGRHVQRPAAALGALNVQVHTRHGELDALVVLQNGGAARGVDLPHGRRSPRRERKQRHAAPRPAGG
mmetsp:Transcript_19836/g.76113  ORF Transcript_19836/g.76113 Transcript_19836/m.76113 type:complete len:203 (-) Transcript_19836:20-628(-)